MTEFLSLFLARPTGNLLKCNTDGMIKTGPFQGKIIFYLNSGSFSPTTDSGQNVHSDINFV